MGGKRRLRINNVYSSLQVLHKINSIMIRRVGPLALALTEVLIIFTSFAVIRLSHALHPILLADIFSISVVALALMRYIIKFAVQITQRSATFGIPLLCTNRSLDGGHTFIWGRTGISSRGNVRFERSCRPFIWELGLFRLSSDTFPTIAQGVILDNLINLLVAY